MVRITKSEVNLEGHLDGMGHGQRRLVTAVHGVTKSWTWLSTSHTHTHTHTHTPDGEERSARLTRQRSRNRLPEEWMKEQLLQYTLMPVSTEELPPEQAGWPGLGLEGKPPPVQKSHDIVGCHHQRAVAGRLRCRQCCRLQVQPPRGWGKPSPGRPHT